MGYSAEQLADLEATVQAADADVVLVATPIDLSRLVDLGKPSVRATYRVESRPGGPSLEDVVGRFCAEHGLGSDA
jgi:predicted GTPase